MKEVNQIIYNILRTQVKFGAYGYGAHLPPMEEMAELLVVSMDTILIAYRQLQKEGYITLSKSIGSVVKVHYDAEEIEQNIQTYFSENKDTLLDIYRSIPLLFGNAQFMAWKNTPLEELYNLADKVIKKQVAPSYLAILFLHIVYGSLNNNLLMRLIHKLSITYMVPILSLKDCSKHVNSEINLLPSRIELCRQEDWAALRADIYDSMDENFRSLDHFYKTRITAPASKEPHFFTWSSYKKASQICYTLGLEFLSLIFRNHYPVGSFLASYKELAEENKVSVSTIRHTLTLLNDLGIVKTYNGIGTQVLSIEQAAQNCNLSNATVQKRLLDCKQSLQLFTLSCRDVTAYTVSALEAGNIAQWIEQLDLFERLGKLDLVSPFSLRFISQVAPYSTVRTVYAELYKQLLWGVPLRGMMGTQEKVNAFYRPYYHALCDLLKKSDAEGVAVKLEEILNHEFKFVTERLDEFGIQDFKQKEEDSRHS